MPKNSFTNSIRRDSDLLDKAVATYFQSIAKKNGLPLMRIQDGIYEMPSPYFILRVEAYAGHSSRSVGASLRKTSLRAFGERVAGFDYGITWFMQLNGENVDQFKFPINNDEDFLKQVRLYAGATEEFGLSYLLGSRDDFEAVGQFVREQSKPSVERIKQMQRDIERKMKNVRQEWPVVITRQRGDEWETVNELKASDIRFLGELDGKKENAFKARLVEFFKRDQSVERAYLARVIGQNLPANGVLCLQRRSGFDRNIRGKIGEIFSDVFSIQDNFYIFFPTCEQESSIAKFCQTFFVNK